MSKSKSANRILAIYPNCGGFGFALLEGRDLLVDWGFVATKSDKNRQCLSRIRAFILRYTPDGVVTESARKSTHRGVRIRKLLSDIHRLSVKLETAHRCLSRADVRESFRGSQQITKRRIAEGISERFQELSSRLPPPRKPWMSEDSRMAIFDAIALALTVPKRRRKRRAS
jgi:hypothetical protein